VVVPKDLFTCETVITAIAFERAPMGSSSVILEGLTVRIGEARSAELGDDFALNLKSGEAMTLVLSATTFTVADHGSGRAVLPLETPYVHSGGHLLLDMSFDNLQGNMYTWGWDAGSSILLSASGARAATGRVSSMAPVLVLMTD
jgi:hypothetical protein